MEAESPLDFPVLELICSVLAGSPQCAGTRVDTATCDEMTGAYVYVLRPTEAAERAALEQALDVMTRRLQGPDLCTLEAALNDDGTITLRVVSVAEESPLNASALAPGALHFYAVDETLGPGEVAPGYAVFPDRTGAPVTVEWESLLPPDPITSAEASEREYGWVIDAMLTPDGAAAFADVTASLVDRRLAIAVDDVILMTPTIMEPITGGAFIITADFDAAEATALATILRGGALPDGMALELTSIDVEPWPQP